MVSDLNLISTTNGLANNRRGDKLERKHHSVNTSG